MKTLLSQGFRWTAIASLGFWWVWLMGGVAFYFCIQQASVWESITSGTGLSLAASVSGSISCFIADLIAEPHP